jgi:uncharacterized protein DUF4265
MNNRKEILVRIQLEPDAWHGTTSEGIWATLVQPVGDKAIVEVDNIPFYSENLSLGDKICIFRRDDGMILLDSIVERGGHSTYRILVKNKNIEAAHLLDLLKAMRCDWEKTKFNEGDLYALDIPPEVDIDEVYEILEKGLKNGSWLFEEGYVGHPPKDGPASALS